MAIDPAEMRGLLDRQAITEQIYRYCRAVAGLDIPLGHSVFHEDARANYADSLYRGDGRAAAQNARTRKGTAPYARPSSM